MSYVVGICKYECPQRVRVEVPLLDHPAVVELPDPLVRDAVHPCHVLEALLDQVLVWEGLKAAGVVAPRVGGEENGLACVANKNESNFPNIFLESKITVLRQLLAWVVDGLQREIGEHVPSPPFVLVLLPEGRLEGQQNLRRGLVVDLRSNFILFYSFVRQITEPV